jgi:hypothetical protein
MDPAFQVQRLEEAAWVDLGNAAAEDPAQAVDRLATGAGIYRCQQAGHGDLWRFLYVDEDGRTIDSGAASRL